MKQSVDNFGQKCSFSSAKNGDYFFMQTTQQRDGIDIGFARLPISYGFYFCANFQICKFSLVVYIMNQKMKLHHPPIRALYILNNWYWFSKKSKLERLVTFLKVFNEI